MGCVTLVSYAVLVNGCPTDFFPVGRGLRQGFPLSPLLFLLVIEGLSRLIIKAKAEGNINGIKISGNLSICHLLFVNDIMIFGSSSIAEWHVYYELIKEFCNVSGLSINTKKYLLLENEASAVDLLKIKDLFQVQSFPFVVCTRYLGYFIKPNGYKAGDWLWLL